MTFLELGGGFGTWSSLAGSACLPNWRLPDLVGPFDVFMNAYSFWEMEPDVVDHYIQAVAD